MAPAIESVGIIGAGMMGRSIAAESLLGGLRVVLGDLAEETLAGAAEAVVRRLGEAGSPGPRQTVARLLRTTIDPAAPAQCDLVLESIVESLAAKRQLYAQLRPHLKQGAIWASNSSTIPIARLADGAADPARFCGLHFLRPVEQRPLVEIVRGPQTCDRTIAAAVGYVRRLGRTAIVVGDGPGFVVNRMLFPYLGAALELLGEGVDPAAIDRAAGEFGMGLGPLRLMDEIGLDTTLQAGLVLAEAFPERIVRSGLIVSMIKAGRLGKKAGLGFYAYGPAGEPASCGPGRGAPRNRRALDRSPGSGLPPLSAGFRGPRRGSAKRPDAAPTGVAAAVASGVSDAVGGRANPRRRESRRSARPRPGGAVGARISGRQRRFAVLGRLAGPGPRGAADTHGSRPRNCARGNSGAASVGRRRATFLRVTPLSAGGRTAAFRQRRWLPAGAASPW